MIRKLFIIAGAGFVLSVVCLSAAAALLSRDMAAKGWTWDQFEKGHFARQWDGDPVSDEPQAIQNLTWTGGDRLAIEVPADVTFVQGETASVVVTGPKRLTDQVQLIDGKLSFKPNTNGPNWGHQSALTVTITAPKVTRFELNGSGDLRIQGYDQPSLDISLSGSGYAEASGYTKVVKLDISGSGEADLDALRTAEADVTITGSGEASLAPTDRADVTVSGSGDVDLKSRPIKLTTQISGSGSISQE